MNGVDIRDIHGPIPIPPWWHGTLLIGLAALAAVVVALGVWAWRTRRARALTPLQLALRALDSASSLARAGQTHEWAELVAATLRGALAARLGTDVLPRTTEELRGVIEEKLASTSAPDARHVVQLLATCDLARFARARLEPGELLDATVVARNLTTRFFAPPPPPPPPENTLTRREMVPT